jgi:hypothetical protein
MISGVVVGLVDAKDEVQETKRQRIGRLAVVDLGKALDLAYIPNPCVHPRSVARLPP